MSAPQIVLQPIRLGQDSSRLPRKRGLPPEYFFVSEAVSVCISGEKRRVGVITALESGQDIMTVHLGDKDEHRIPYQDVKDKVSKFIGYFFLLTERSDENLNMPDQSFIPIMLGQNSQNIPRKRLLSAEYFYQNELVSVLIEDSTRKVGIVSSLNGCFQSNQGTMSVMIGADSELRVRFDCVPNIVSKLMGYYYMPQHFIIGCGKSRHGFQGLAIEIENVESLEKIKKQVEAGINRRNDQFVRTIFDSHKDVATNATESISARSLGTALSNLDFFVNAPESIAELLKSRGLNDDGGLDFQEFRSLVNTPSPIEEWVSGLPLTQLVADAMPRTDVPIKDQLRHLCKATAAQLKESCEVIKEGLLKILQEKLDALKDAYEKLDSHAASGSNSKFQVFGMNVGSIADFDKGLASRIGSRPPATRSARPPRPPR